MKVGRKSKINERVKGSGRHSIFAIIYHYMNVATKALNKLRSEREFIKAQNQCLFRTL